MENPLDPERIFRVGGVCVGGGGSHRTLLAGGGGVGRVLVGLSMGLRMIGILFERIERILVNKNLELAGEVEVRQQGFICPD